MKIFKDFLTKVNNYFWKNAKPTTPGPRWVPIVAPKIYIGILSVSLTQRWELSFLYFFKAVLSGPDHNVAYGIEKSIPPFSSIILLRR